jgi:hypothetical protein
MRRKVRLTGYHYVFNLSSFSDEIKGFLETFKSADKDFTLGFADIDINSEPNPVPTELAGLKYKRLLVSYQHGSI